MKVRACALTVTLTLLFAAAPAHSDASLPTGVSGLRLAGHAAVIARTAGAFFIATTSSTARDDEPQGHGAEESEIYRLPRAGGTPARIAVVPAAIDALVVDGDDLFFSKADGLYRLSVRGGATAQPVVRGLGRWEGALAVDAAFVYYIAANDRCRDRLCLDLLRVGRRGGQPERLLADCGAGSVAVDGAYVYVARWQSGTRDIIRVPTHGGATELVTNDLHLDRPDNLRVGVDEVYFTDARPGHVGAAPKRGGPVRWLREEEGERDGVTNGERFSTSVGHARWTPVGLDLDGDTLFVLEDDHYGDRSRVFRLSTDGREHTQLGPVAIDCDAMAFDRRGGLLHCGSSLRRWNASEP